MNETPPSLVEFLFEAALGKTSTAERTAFLDAMCQGQPALRARLDTLLEGHFAGAGFLTSLPPAETPTLDAAIEDPANVPAKMIGRYKLLEKIGEGGFGEVWMAEQREPVKRRVALKIIKLGMDTRQVVARFEAERQALAMMDHSNIAKIYDADMTETGRPYFVMELVRGIKITDYCDQNQLTTRERLDLFIKVCQAIQHAHQKGIIHRDIKPSNILVTLHDGVPVPKVIDFGIAKATQQELTDKTVFTQFQQFIGTPAYISPEQAEMSGLDIDTRADIHSLGVLLYELLIGQTPFDPAEMMKGGLDALRRIIREKEPLRPSTKLNTLQGDARTTTGKRRQTDVGKLAHQLRGDLDWIVMKCLEKDRTRRYDTANGLAMDIQRHLANEPITARPPSTAYKIQKAWQRNKLAYTSAVLVAMALVVGATVSLWQALRATRAQAAESQQRSVAQEKQKEAETAQRRAEASEKRTSDLLYSAKLNLAQVAFEQSNFRRVHELLEETRDHPKRGFEWNYWQRQIHGESRILRGIIGEVHRVAFSPDGTRVAAHGLTQLIVWDAASGRELLNVPAPHKNYASRDDYSTRLRFSPDGKQLLMLGEGGLDVRDAFTGTKLFTLKGVNGGDYSPDGSLIATVIYRVPEPGIVLWDARTGKRARTFRREASEREALRSARFTGDGKALLLTTCLGVSLLDATTGETIRVIVEDPMGFYDYPTDYLSHDGKRLLESDRFGVDGNVWDATKALGKPQAFPAIHECVSAEFSPDDRWVVATRPDQTASLIDLDTGAVIRSLKGHWGELHEVSLSRDGRWVATASADGSVRLWDLETRQNPHLIISGRNKIDLLSPDERAVLEMTQEGATLRELATGRILRTFFVHPSNDYIGVHGADFSPDGTRIVTGSFQKTADVFDVATGARIFNLFTNLTVVEDAVSYSPDGTKILTSGQGGSRIWEANTGRLLLLIPMNDSKSSRAIFSPDGRQVATTSFYAGTQIWDAKTGNPLRTLEPGGRGGQAKDSVEHLAYSPDGRHLALGQIEGLVTIWEVTTGEKAVTLSGHRRRVTSIGYSPDGRRLLTASDDGTDRLWDVETGSELLALKQGGFGNSARIFADGRRILTWGWDGGTNYNTLLWEAATPEAEAAWTREHREAQENMKKRLVAAEADAKAAREARARQLTEAAVSPEPIPRHRPPSSGFPMIAGDPGVIRQWLVLAPLPGQSDTELAVLKQQIPNESRLRPRAGERPSPQSGGPAWTPVRLGENSQRLNFLDLVRIADPEADTDDQVAYAVAYIVSESPQSGLSLLVGSDDTARAYINGKEIYRQLEGRGWKADQDEVPGIELKAGLNVLVFKVANGLGGWDGSVRFTTADGHPVPGLTVTLDPDATR